MPSSPATSRPSPVGRAFRIGAFLAAIVACTGAQDDPGGLLYLTYDNDLVAKSDDGYSGGIYLGCVSPYAASYTRTPVRDVVGRALDRLPFVRHPDRRRFVAYRLSQLTYTPDDTDRVDLVVDDMPYSGLLLFSATAAAQDARHHDALTLTVGVVGPASLAQEVQEGLHRATGNATVDGWDNQLQNEPILNLQYDHRWRAWDFASGERTHGDIILGGGVALGNMHTMANVGVGLRWGLNVPEDTFVPPPFYGQESVGAMAPATDHAHRRPMAYLALGLDAALSANQIQFDGNTFRDSHRVDHDHWTARGYLGIHVRLGRVVMAVALIQSTVPWDRPDGARWERHGRALIGWDF